MVSTSGDDTSSDSHIRGELGSAIDFAALKALRRYRYLRIVPAVQAILRRENYFSWVYSRGIAIAGVATRALRSQGEEGFQALLHTAA